MAANDQPVRVALVGAGEIAEVAHLPAWSAAGDARVDVLVDPNQERAQRIAAEFGIPNCAVDFEELLQSGDVDAVDICTPPHLHAPMVLNALDAGLHVLVEKPMATNLLDGEAIARAARASGKTVMIAENWLFSSARREAEEIIRKHALGQPFLVKARHESSLYVASTGGAPAWTFSPDTAGGGYLMQAGIHTVALIEAMVGPFQEVSGYTSAGNTPPDGFLESTAVLTALFESGALGSLAFTARSQHLGPRRLGLELFFDKGSLELDVWTGRVSYTVEGRQTTVEDANSSMGFAEEISHFVHCLRTGSEPETSPARLLSSLKTVFAAYESARTGNSVRPSNVASTPAPAGAKEVDASGD
ncbi:Gfo/Idh/MocA family protein [Pseudarthrobacter sp. NamE2]|uniref:Gfo/Idh/MocA family protein n=1 Tax=Pseudarthrobacter sp. NamE2 TaxID=2576838 RepID=UPI0014853B25|nr:Gfo/Idh/MocA family oxidoreductase [Pseudarthrobacter sp. NamE2]